MSFIAPVFVILATSSILASPEHKEQADTPLCIATQMRQLKTVINAGSALLVAEIIHTNAWLQWPIALVPEAQIREEFSEIAMSIVIFWGTTFTLLLFTIAAPAFVYLSKKAQVLAQRELQTGRISDPQKWLRNRGLSNNFGDQLPQVIAVLAPLLAGPVGSALTSAIK